MTHVSLVSPLVSCLQFKKRCPLLDTFLVSQFNKIIVGLAVPFAKRWLPSSRASFFSQINTANLVVAKRHKRLVNFPHAPTLLRPRDVARFISVCHTSFTFVKTWKIIRLLICVINSIRQRYVNLLATCFFAFCRLLIIFDPVFNVLDCFINHIASKRIA